MTFLPRIQSPFKNVLSITNSFFDPRHLNLHFSLFVDPPPIKRWKFLPCVFEVSVKGSTFKLATRGPWRSVIRNQTRAHSKNNLAKTSGHYLAGAVYTPGLVSGHGEVKAYSDSDTNSTYSIFNCQLFTLQYDSIIWHFIPAINIQYDVISFHEGKEKTRKGWLDVHLH